MKNSKNIEQILKKLDEIEEIVCYYSNNSNKYDNNFKQIRELIEDLSLDRKKDHIRLAKKLKGIWEREQK